MWVPTLAAVFFWLSNPLAMEPDVGRSIDRAVVLVLAAVVLTLPGTRLPRAPLAVVLFLALVVASTAWSVNGWVTFNTATLTVKLALLGMACVACASPRTIAYGVNLGGVVVLVTSVYAYWADLPNARIALGLDGYLAGVGTNRNILAYTMVLSLGFALAVIPRTWWARVLWALGLIASLVGIFLAQSGTGFVAAGALLAVSLGLAVLQRWKGALTRKGRRLIALGGALLMAGIVVGWPALGAVVGRDSATLSGRTDLWGATWHATQDRLWLGQGWGSVWPHPWWTAVPANGVYDQITAEAGVALSHGHNSLFDVLPEVGLVGVLLLVCVHASVLIGSLRWLPRSEHGGEVGDWSRTRIGALGVMGLALFGVTEPMATIPLGWFVLVVLVALALPPRSQVTAHTVGDH